MDTREELLYRRVQLTAFSFLQILDLVLMGLQSETGKSALGLRTSLSVESVLGISLDGSLEVNNSLVLLSGGLLGSTEVVEVGGRETGLNSLGLLERSHSSRVVLAVVLLDTEKMECVGVLGVNFDCLLEVLGGLTLQFRLLLELGKASQDQGVPFVRSSRSGCGLNSEGLLRVILSLVEEVEDLIVVLAKLGLLEENTGNAPLDLSVVTRHSLGEGAMGLLESLSRLDVTVLGGTLECVLDGADGNLVPLRLLGQFLVGESDSGSGNLDSGKAGGDTSESRCGTAEHPFT
ncbi:hypothetical protein PFISCL1PPCAC_1732, partial [Pristionchus fissidentatus]